MAELAISMVSDIALGKVKSKLETYLDEQYEYQTTDVKGKLAQMEQSITRIESLVSVAQAMEIKEPSLLKWLSELKNAIYDAEYVMDVFEYERLKNEVEGWPKATTGEMEKKGKLSHLFKLSLACCSKIQETASVVAKRLIFADDDLNDLLAVVAKFDSLVKEMDKFTNLLQLYHSTQHSALLPNYVPAAAVANQSRETTSAPVEDKLFGRGKAEMRLLELLLESSESETKCFSVVSVVGVGGVGKTALAQSIFNHQSFKNKFDIKAWVCVSNNFSITSVMKAIVQNSGIERPSDFHNFTTLEEIQKHLLKGLQSKRFLIVLDDVWEDMEGKWEKIQVPFSNGSIGSKILITCRSDKVAKGMGSHEKSQIKLEPLEFEHFWNFFQKCAFRNFEKAPRMVHVGKQIAHKLGGLPLAAKTVGGSLNKNFDFKYWGELLDSNVWKEEIDGVIPALKLSYNHLPSHLKKCFAYCCLFPKDYKYKAKTFFDIWTALDCFKSTDKGKRLVDVGQEYINELVSGSFLSIGSWEIDDHYDKEEVYVIHDLLHDLAERIVGDEVYRVEYDESLSKEVPHNVHHLYIQSTYDGLDLILQKIAPKQLQSLVYVPVYRTIVEERELKMSKEAIQNIKGLRLLHFKTIYKFHFANEMQFWENLGRMRHLRCTHFDFYDPGTLTCFPPTSWKPFLLEILWWSKSRTVDEHMCINSHNLINLRYVSNMHIPHMGYLKSLEAIPQGIFTVDGEDGNDIGQLGELNKIGGELTLKVCVKLTEAEVKKANLNRKQYLTKLRIINKNDLIDGEAIKALQPHKNLEAFDLSNCSSITMAPDWLCTLSNLTTLRLSSLPNLKGFPPELGSHLWSLKELWLYSLPSVELIEVATANGDDQVFPTLVYIQLHNMEKFKGWSPHSPIYFPKLSYIEIYNCPKLLTSRGSQNSIIFPLCSPNCNVRLRISYYPDGRYKGEELCEEEINMDVNICVNSLIVDVDDTATDLRNGMLLSHVRVLRIDSSIRFLHASLSSKFSSLHLLELYNWDKTPSLDQVAHLPPAKKLVIKGCQHLKFLSAANNGIQTIFSSFETIDIQFCGLETLVDTDSDILSPTAAASLKSLAIRNCSKLKFLFVSKTVMFPSIETLVIEDCVELESLNANNDDSSNVELPHSVNTLIIKKCNKLKLSANTLQMLPSIHNREIEECEEIQKQQQEASAF